MKQRAIVLLTALLIAGFDLARAAGRTGLQVPKTVEAGNAFTISTNATVKAALYIVSPAQVLRRDVQPGASVVLAEGDLHNAGHYLALLVTPSSTEKAEFDVVASSQTTAVSFLAKPSRLPVNLPEGISGVAYVFDTFHNLVLKPGPVTFQLSDAGGAAQTRNVATRNGVAWVKMNSAPKAGPAQFQVNAGSVAHGDVDILGGDPDQCVG